MTVHTVGLLLETLRLRPRLDPARLARAWPAVQPQGLLALADYEKGAMWLHRRLCETGSDNAAPEIFIALLRRTVRSALARNMLIDGEAVAVSRRLSELGIPHVLLKGVALRAAQDRVPYGNARTTSDVDVLLPEGEVNRAWEDLRAAGYVQAFPKSLHHAPPLIGPGSVAVELHSSLSPSLPADEAWRRANDGAVDLAWNGLQVRIPSATELLWHGTSHALLDGGKAWRLRYFIDAAALLAAEPPMAWDVIARRLDSDEVPARSAPRRWLATAAEFAGMSLPETITQGAAPLDLDRAYRWRLGVLANGTDQGLRGRLLEEGTRSEVGLGIGGAFAGSGAWKQARRRLGGLAARMIYRCWRAWN